jgi:hypothetical protein
MLYELDSISNKGYRVVLGIQLILAIVSIFYAPDPAQVDDELDSFIEIQKQKGKEKKRHTKMDRDDEPEPQWEMVPIPQTPRNMPMSPMTPRTKAFSALSGPGGR